MTHQRPLFAAAGGLPAALRRSPARRGVRILPYARPARLPAGRGMTRYRVIYADPPWRFVDRSGSGVAEKHYATMSLDEIAALPVAEWVAQDAALFLWVIQPLLPEALDLIRAWGFNFKTVAFAWVKISGGQHRLFYAAEDVRLGLGYHTRAGMEQCWLATRGRGYDRLSRGEAQVVFSPLREHSRKPDEIAESIVRLTGDVSRLEMFARTRRRGWDAWGNEVDKFTSAAS